MAKLSIRIVDWKPLRRGSLRGFAIIDIPEVGMRVFDVTVYQKDDGSRWASLPSRPWVRGGELALDDQGKPRYSPCMEFNDAKVKRAFSDRVIAALVAHAPAAYSDADAEMQS